MTSLHILKVNIDFNIGVLSREYVSALTTEVSSSELELFYEYDFDDVSEFCSDMTADKTILFEALYNAAEIDDIDLSDIDKVYKSETEIGSCEDVYYISRNKTAIIANFREDFEDYDFVAEVTENIWIG